MQSFRRTLIVTLFLTMIMALSALSSHGANNLLNSSRGGVKNFANTFMNPQNPTGLVLNSPQFGQSFSELQRQYSGVPPTSQAAGQQLYQMSQAVRAADAKLANSIASAQVCMANATMGSPIPNNLIGQAANAVGSQTTQLIGAAATAAGALFSNGQSNPLNQKCKVNQKALDKYNAGGDKLLASEADEILCSQSVAFLDAAEGKLEKFENDRCQLSNVPAAMRCVEDAEAALTTAANEVGSQLNQFTKASEKNVSEREGLIETHENTAKNLNEVHQKLTVEMERLKSLERQLHSALTGQMPPGGGELPKVKIIEGVDKDGESSGFDMPGALIERAEKGVDQVKADVAKRMHGFLINSVNSCFSQKKIACEAGKASISFGECAQRYLAGTGTHSVDKIFTARTAKNLQERGMLVNMSLATESMIYKKLNYDQPDTIITSATRAMSNVKQTIIRSIMGTDASGMRRSNARLAKIAQLADRHWESCKQEQLNTFKLCTTALNRNACPNDQITAMFEQAQGYEKEVKEHAIEWGKFLTERMSQFQKAFYGTVENIDGSSRNELEMTDLACRESKTAKEAVNCVKQLHATLVQSLKGTSRRIPLVLPDAQGQTDVVECNNIQHCLGKMQKRAKSHTDAASAQKSSLTKFVGEHNGFVEQQMAQTAAKVQNIMSSSIKQQLGGQLGFYLSSLGVQAQPLKFKSIEAEKMEKGTLKDGESPGIYKSPSNFMQALSGMNNLEQIDPASKQDIAKAVKDKMESINKEKRDLQAKVGPVARKNRQCQITEKDLARLKSSLNCGDLPNNEDTVASKDVKDGVAFMRTRVNRCSALGDFLSTVNDIAIRVKEDTRYGGRSFASSGGPFSEYETCVDRVFKSAQNEIENKIKSCDLMVKRKKAEAEDARNQISLCGMDPTDAAAKTKCKEEATKAYAKANKNYSAQKLACAKKEERWSSKAVEPDPSALDNCTSRIRQSMGNNIAEARIDKQRELETLRKNGIVAYKKCLRGNGVAACLSLASSISLTPDREYTPAQGQQSTPGSINDRRASGSSRAGGTYNRSGN